MNISNSNHILKELDQVIIALLIHAPFFGRLLAKTVKVVDSSCFGVSLISFKQEVVRLCVNPDYWNNYLKSGDEKQTLQLRKNALKKQVLHFIFNHDLHIHDFENDEIFILSAELAANQYLEHDGKIAGMIFPVNFSGLKLIPFKQLQHYYKTISEKLIISELESTFGFRSKHFDYFKTWKNLKANKSDYELEWHFRKQFITKTFQSDLEKIEKTIPIPLFSYLNHLKNDTYRPINWRRVIRLFCNSSNHTKLSNTIHRASKRYGTFPGTRIRKQSRILVAVDTSASIKEEDFKLFFDEIHQLWKQNTEIKIVECDTIMQREYDYKGIPPKIISGRGNTDFNAAIRFLNEVFQADALIYFTDGFGPIPRIKPTKPILWIIKKEGIKRLSKTWNDLPGRKVKMGFTT
jgi:predicted metal-dependent peptidase